METNRSVLGQSLKNQLTQYCKDPGSSFRLPLFSFVVADGLRTRLSALNDKFHIENQPLGVFKYALGILFLRAIREGDSSHTLAFGILLLWHGYLEKINTNRIIPPLHNVIRHCSSVENIAEFDQFIAQIL